MGCEEKVHQFIIHGLAVQLHSQVPEIEAAIREHFGAFAEADHPASFSTTTGFIGPYDSSQVLRHVSPKAVPLTGIGFGREAYQDGERIWLLDDRCGLCEINFIKRQWRAWVLKPALADIHRCIDSALLWPLAQLLRIKGLHILPAASVTTGHFAAIVLCPFGIPGELSALAAAGYHIIGQRWTALRKEENRISLLHMPGGIAQTVWPRRPSSSLAPDDWFDLHSIYPESRQHHAFCDAVIVVSSGRRPQASANGLSRWEAGDVIRRAWPIAELHPRKRGGAMASEIGKTCQCVEARLSPRGEDILEILDAVRKGRIGHGSGRLTLFIQPRGMALAG